jgi:two-component system response regulator HydG
MTVDEKVLVVDDETMILDTYGAFLAMGGYVPLLAASAAEARAFLEEGENVSLVITDLKMPEESGLSFLNYLNQTYSHIPTVVITGNPDAGASCCAYENGVIDFLVKPVRKAEFLSVIDNILRVSEASDEINGDSIDELLKGLQE